MLDPAAYVTEPAPGRECGTCTLCCKVYDVPALEKPAGTWCRHCRPGQGCGIHATRPPQCRSFNCLWMCQDWLGPEWKPERAKMVLSVDPTTRFLFVQVDPGAANSWKRDPYHRQLRQWAATAHGRHVVVFVNKSATIVLPDRDVPVGIMGPTDRIVTRERRTPAGMTVDVEKISGA